MLTIHGMVDPHTHLRDLDWSHKATFYSETCAAVAGGYWAVFDMPNTPPTTLNADAFAVKERALASKAVCDFGIYVGASQADNTTEYPNLADASCGLKIFNNSTTGDLLLERQEDRLHHYQSWDSRKLIAVHAEEETVQDILSLVRLTRKHTHFLHVSTAKELNLIRAAKEEGLPITCGVCPHHLYLTQADEATLKGYGVMKPSLKTANDRDALWNGIRAGVVDIIESDHAPHTRAEKERENPAFGVPGLETTVPLMLNAVAENRVRLEQIVPMVSSNVCRIWGLQVPANTYTLIDPTATYTLENSRQFTACGWTPFDGMKVTGKVIQTWIRGTQVFDGEQVLVEGGFGKNLFRN
jgi:dihydroorotase-like cyclic amidohydrolase